MILANLRQRITADDLTLVVRLLSGGVPQRADALRERAAVEGPDVLLDHDGLPRALRSVPEFGSPSAALYIYVIVRHALRDAGIDDVPLSDYLGALVLEFGLRGRAYRIASHDDDEFRYLADILSALQDHTGRRAFLLRAHLGNFSLWLAGVFPAYVVTRRERRGAPGFRYYEDVGASGFRLAAEHEIAQQVGLSDVYRRAAASFRTLRVALNGLSGRLFFPAPARAGAPLRPAPGSRP
ncbi:MAG: hypothetical protein PVF27_04420 [Gemmatimonadales bacterium]|jgi:hypothetical protein